MALNEKQEKFAEAYVLHRNATEAAKAAGYSATSANNQGYSIMQLQEVIDRVHELEQELETDVNVIEEIESQYTFAKANGHTNSAIKALELLSRIRGSNSDSGLSMDKDTLETAIVGCLNVLGEEESCTAFYLSVTSLVPYLKKIMLKKSWLKITKMKKYW